ncbi:chaperonin 10-like protein [Dipodascopsis uninucleata]
MSPPVLINSPTGSDADSHSEYYIRKNVLPSMDNPALIVTKDHTIKMEQMPIPVPKADEVLLHVKCSGICGSDIHFWKAGAIGELKVLGDCILGHESAGIVLGVGEDVRNVAVGDRVAIEPGVPCNKCFLCQDGKYNLCEDVAFIGVYPYHGSLRRYMVHKARYVFRIPENMTYAQGALVEPLSVVMHAVERAPLKFGKSCLISGCGPIGLIALAVAKASGASPIVITDVVAERLEFAKKFVPGCLTYCINVNNRPEENAKEIRKLYGPNEYDAPPTVLECTGIEASVVTACFTVQRAGQVMVIGVGRAVMNNIPFMHLSLAEIDLTFTNRYHDTWPRGIQSLSQGLLNLDKLVTHTFPLEQAEHALKFSADIRNGSIKVHILDEVDTEDKVAMGIE